MVTASRRGISPLGCSQHHTFARSTCRMVFGMQRPLHGALIACPRSPGFSLQEKPDLKKYIAENWIEPQTRRERKRK